MPPGAGVVGAQEAVRAVMGTGVPGAHKPDEEWEWFRIPLKGRADWPRLLSEKGLNECYYHGMPFGMLPAFLMTG
eukprot:12681608-Prorocentrum_lima.AAC.1